MSASLDLARRAVACKGWRWMPGVLARWGDCSARADDIDARAWNGHSPAFEHLLPDLDDPATLGCLLALVREAWGNETLTTDYCEGMDSVAWAVVDSGKHRPHGYGATEAESLVAALEAAP